MNEQARSVLAKDIRLLIIEDKASDAALMVRELERGGYTVDHRRVETVAELREALATASWDAILADYSLPGFDASAALAIVRGQKRLDLPFIVVSGTIDEDVAVQVMKAGASDYFHKDKLQRLVPALERELRDFVHRQKRREAEDQVRQAEYRFAKAFHSSPIGIAITRLADGVALATNQRFLDITGYEESVIIGKAGKDLDLWVDADQRRGLVEHLRRAGSAQSVEVELWQASGRRIFTLLSAELVELDGELCILTFVQDITERKEQQQVILEAKLLLEKTFASLSEAVLVINAPDRRILMCNAAVEYILGYHPDELIGQSTEVLHIDHAHFRAFGETSEEALATSNTFHTEYEMQHKDGHVISTEHMVTSLYPEQGYETGVVSVIRDTTARKQAEAQAERANERVRLLRDIAIAANEAPDIDAILRVTLDKVCAYTGWEVGHAYLFPDGKQEQQQLVSLPIWHLSDATRLAAFRRRTETAFDVQNCILIQQVLEQREMQWFDVIDDHPGFPRAGVARRCGLHSAYAFALLANNRIAGVLEFFSSHPADERAREIGDITTHIGTQVGHVIERQRTRAKLAESDENYRALFDGSLNAIYIHDFEGNFIDANPAALDLLGYERHEILQISFQDLMEPRDLERSLQQVQQTIVDGFQREVTEYSLRRKDGAVVTVETLSSVIYREGNPWAVQGIARDITARKEAEASLQRYAERLELLRAIDRAILSVEPPETVAQNTLRQVKHMIPFFSATVIAFDDDFEHAKILALEADHEGSWQAGDRIPTANHTGIELLQQDQTYVVRDTEQKRDQISPFEQRLADLGVRSYMAAPLISRGNLLGALTISADQPNALSSSMIGIAREIASHLAVVLENARLLKIERQRTAELTALHDASLQLTRSLDMKTVLDLILDYAILLVDADDAHIFLYDGDRLTFGSAFWGNEKQPTPYAEPRSDGLTYTVARSGERRIVANVNESALFEDWPWGGAIIGLPLKVGGKVNGVMSLAFDAPHAFEAQLVRVLELLADQAAIAINNAQLYEQIHAHADQLEHRVAARTAELQYQKERMETILHSSSDAILLLARDGRVLQANRAFCDTFGWDASAIAGQTLTALARIKQTGRLQNALQQVTARQAFQRIELTAHKPNGEPFEADVVLSPIQDDDAGQQEIVCNLRDITARKQIEAELRNALAKERELSELKSSFTSMVSHEFRTPLAAILTSVDLLRKYHDRLTVDRRQKKLDTIKSQVKRLNHLMDEVLIIGRADSVGLSFNPRSVNVLALCEEIIDEVKAVEGDGVTVTLASEGPCTALYVDPDLVRHIIQNLVSNAVKYSTSGGTVTVTLRCSGAEVVLVVADEGIGIPAEDQDKLFTIFQRAKNVGTIQGTGFGLSIVRRALERHGGSIDFVSVEGEGSTFTARLPVRSDGTSTTPP